MATTTVEPVDQVRADREEALRAERLDWALRGGPPGFICDLGDHLVRFDGQPGFGARSKG